MTSSGPGRGGSAKKGDRKHLATPDKVLSSPADWEGGGHPRTLKLNKIDAMIAAVAGFFFLFFYCGADEFMWKQLYVPR